LCPLGDLLRECILLTEVMSCSVPESDWKLLRQLKPLALQRYCDRVLDNVAKISTDESKNSHERYLDVYRYILSSDEELARAFNDHRRSTAIFRLAVIKSLRLLTPEEFGRFSEGTRQTVEVLSDE